MGKGVFGYVKGLRGGSLRDGKIQKTLLKFGAAREEEMEGC